MRRLFAAMIAALSLVVTMASVYSYDVVNLPETMTLSDAWGLFDASQIDHAEASSPREGRAAALSEEQYLDFYYEFANVELHRYITPSPFRGICLTLYAADGTAYSYYTGGGVIIGSYGDGNYMCYKAEGDDESALWELTSLYYDNTNKQTAEASAPVLARDFLELPQEAWAEDTVKEAASRCLLPYEFTKMYSQNITREEFCVLIGNFIAVASGYTDLETYMLYTGQPYVMDVFEDCTDADISIDILYELGIVNGKTETLFDPDAYITREEAAKLLCETAELYMYIESPSGSDYDDGEDISAWAQFFVDWVSDAGIMNGVDSSNFAPKDNYTVLQAIITVNRLYDHVNENI